ncbi:MAG: tyrosine-protein phosphatase [Nocardiopsaceae bacterium]|jgi:protein-tyrosine phosphatase|nr:tyrosine-protein phosphatase [Nocardiopsaceae bacterium]
MTGCVHEGECGPATSDATDLIARIRDAGGRRIDVGGTLNFRDTGGYPVAGGGVTRWRRLLRSDGLHRLDPAGRSVLRTLGLRTVLDLRTNDEAQIAPSPHDELARAGAITMHVSLFGDDLDVLPAELTAIYDFCIDERGKAIGAAIKSLARPSALPALVHCTAGKDRTGIVVAFALAAVGVPDEFVAADYALSGMYLDPLHTPTIGRVQESTGLGERLTAELLASPPELITRAIGRARRHAGSVADYLGAYGVTCAELTALRSALVTEGEEHHDGG